MTYIRGGSVRCDGCGRLVVFPGDVGRGNALDAVRRDGWQRVRRSKTFAVDFCPSCKTSAQMVKA